MIARPATLDDVECIASIYNQGIEDRIATFETTLRTAADICSWLGQRHPLIVVEHTAEVIAFARASPYRERACYADVAEFSVYVARHARGQGAGKLAMRALIDAARSAGFFKLVARVFVTNSKSRALLASLGFREVGVYEKHARLDGHWHDVVIVEKLLHSPATVSSI